MKDTDVALNELAKCFAEMTKILTRRDKGIARLMSSMQQQLEITSVLDYARILEDHQSQIDELNKECLATLKKYVRDCAPMAGMYREDDALDTYTLSAREYASKKPDAAILLPREQWSELVMEPVCVDRYWVSTTDPTVLLVSINKDRGIDLFERMADADGGPWRIDKHAIVIGGILDRAWIHDDVFFVISCEKIPAVSSDTDSASALKSAEEKIVNDKINELWPTVISSLRKAIDRL